MCACFDGLFLDSVMVLW